MKKNTYFLLTILSLPLIFTIIPVQARLDGLTIGETITYKVTQFDYPSYNYIYGDPEDLPYDPNDYKFDLTGTILGMKIMDKGTDGYYSANQYIVLDKDIQIPIPYYPDASESENVLYEMFGETITIPGGVGIGLGMTATLSDLLYGINNPDQYDYYDYYYYSPIGLSLGMMVLYLDPTEWDTYETYFLESGENDTGTNYYTTTYIDVVRTSSEFIVIVTMEHQYTWDDPQHGYIDTMTNEFRISWFSSGSNAGLLAKQYSLMDQQSVYTGTENSDETPPHFHQEMGIQFDSREYLPLPHEVRNQDDIVLKLEDASVNAITDGFFDVESVNSGIDFLTGELTEATGKEVLKFEIESVQGCYYETSVHTYDSSEQTLVEGSGTIWWNGFTGYPTYKDDYYYRESEPIDYWSGSIAFFPFSPAITPDYDMWRGTTKSLDAIFELISTAIKSTPGVDFFTENGITVDTIDLSSELRTTGDYKYIYLYGGIELNYNSNLIDPSHRSSSWIPDQTLTFILDLDAWISYTFQGLIAGAEINLDLEFEFTNLEVDQGYDGGTWNPVYDNGILDLSMSIKLQNTKFSEVPAASNADPDLGDNGGGLIPSFTLVTAIVVLTFFGALFRRKRI